MTPERLFRLLHEQPTEEALATARRVGGPGEAIVVSACLVGIPCRFDGTHRQPPGLLDHLKGLIPLPLCPEVLAGLGTPRSPMAFVGGDGARALLGEARLLSRDGRDCTPPLVEAVRKSIELARAAGCRRAVLKERSPSCGVRQVHTQPGVIDGCGMFTAACRETGIEVTSDEELLIRP